MITKKIEIFLESMVSAARATAAQKPLDVCTHIDVALNALREMESEERGWTESLAASVKVFDVAITEVQKMVEAAHGEN